MNVTQLKLLNPLLIAVWISTEPASLTAICDTTVDSPF